MQGGPRRAERCGERRRDALFVVGLGLADAGIRFDKGLLGGGERGEHGLLLPEGSILCRRLPGALLLAGLQLGGEGARDQRGLGRFASRHFSQKGQRTRRVCCSRKVRRELMPDLRDLGFD